MLTSSFVYCLLGEKKNGFYFLLYAGVDCFFLPISPQGPLGETGKGLGTPNIGEDNLSVDSIVSTHREKFDK